MKKKKTLLLVFKDIKDSREIKLGKFKSDQKYFAR